MRFFALGLIPFAVACTTNGRADGTTGESASVPVQNDGYVTHLEPAPGIRFPLPVAGVHLDIESFDRTMPPEKFRHELRFVTDADDIEAMIHVWDNPSHLELRAWFDQNFADFVGESTSVRERTAGKAALPAIELDEPASDQAFSQSMVLFATRDHVYLVTAIDPDQVPAAKALFEKLVTGFEPEVAPAVGPANLPRGSK